MSPRIGFISYALDRAPGGIGTYTREMGRALRQTGVSLTVLHAGRALTNPGVVGLPGASRLPALLTLGQVQIAWTARHHRLDVVHDPTGSMPLILTGVRRVATVHDVVPYIYPQTSSWLDLLIYRCWLPLVAPRLDALITVSEQSKRDIVCFLGAAAEKVTVIAEAAGAQYRPVKRADVERVLSRHGIDTPYILCVGSIEPRKNLPRLLEAYALLRCWSERWKLVVVGARKWKSSPVFSQVERLGLASSVIFTGFVPDEDLPAIYSGSSLFVFPTLYEGFGLPVLEAMACGSPVVTSTSSSLPEVAGDAAILVDPYDVDALSSAMSRVLADPDLAANLRQRGFARAHQFKWEYAAQEVANVYERILS